MTQTTARIKQAGKHFEIIVNLEGALKYKRGESQSINFLEIDKVFTDAKKGLVPAGKDLKEAFGTEDLNTIVSKIVRNGEVQLTQDFRDEEREKKIKQVVDLLSKSAVDPRTGNPHTPDRITRALQEAHVNIKPGSIDAQIKDIIEQVSKVLPMKVEEKKFEITIPAIYTGQAYGVVAPYKTAEEWQNNGDLKVTVNIGSAMVFAFFDKLNSVTHGSTVTEEIKEGTK